MRNSTWKMARPFILRSTGFPAKWMDRLMWTATAAATDVALDAEEALAALATQLLSDLRPVWAARRDSGLRWKNVQKIFMQYRAFNDAELATCADDTPLLGTLKRWNATVETAASLRSKAETTFHADMSDARRNLRELASDTRFQEAVFLSSPHMYASGLARFLQTPCNDPRSGEDKRIERQIVMYLQRFCMKNETTSFFGPIGYGRFADDGKQAEPDTTWPIAWQQSQEISKREAFMAHWAVEALAEVLAQLSCVRAWLRPYLDRSIVRIGERALFIAAKNQTLSLPAEWAAMLDRIDGGTHVVDLSENGGGAILTQLESKGLVRTAIPLPITEVRPLEWLDAFVRDLPDAPELAHWRAGLKRLLTLKQAFTDGSLPQRVSVLNEANALFESLSGMAAQRDAGKIYADRTLFYEECRSGREDIIVSPAFTAQIEASMTRLLNLFAQHGVERAAFLRQFGADLFQQLFGNTTQRVPFLQFLKSALDAPEQSAWTETLRTFKSTVQKTVQKAVQAAATGNHPICLPDALLDALGKDNTLPDDLPLLASPDIMIARDAQGKPKLILGEVHDTLMLWGWALHFHPDPDALTDEMHRFAFGMHLDGVANLLSSKRKKIVPFEYPGVTIEFRARAGNANATLPLAELDVVLENNGLALVARHSGERFVLHNGELASLCHALFALPRCVPFAIDLGAYTPRIEAAGMVLQRARWRMDRHALGLATTYPGTRYALFHAMRKLRRQHGMPECVFVKLPGEPKPVFIDFRCHFLLEAWESLLQEGDAATISEMLPDSGQIWLTDCSGESVTAELRTAFGRAACVAPSSDRSI